MTPERLTELKRTRMFYAADASGDIAIICELLDHIATLEGLLTRARVFVADDVQMVADLSRFSPLPPEDQAKHDSTLAPSEILLPEIDAVLPRAANTPEQQEKST